MVKKVFIIIGIVVGSVAVFAGGVLGVMALMGKFKTPIVYPEKIYFANSDFMVQTDKNLSKLYSFEIKAENSSVDYQVTQTECEIWFESGSEFITLCDSNGEPLTNVKKIYSVDANTPIYYKLKDIDDNVLATKDQKIVINARTNNGQIQLQSENKQTIWLDRKVESIKLDDSTAVDIPTTKTQTITLGVGREYVFGDYIFAPLSSRNPFSKYSSKNVELYYDGSTAVVNSFIDYILVDSNSIQTNEELNSILSYNGSGKLVFKVDDTSKTGTYSFKIAVFASYQDKLDYEAGLGSDKEIYTNRLSNMIVETLEFCVVNNEVSSVAMRSDSLVLSLYTQDLLYVNYEDDTTGTTSSNLEIQMFKEDYQLETSRYNELSFISSFDDLVFSNRDAVFSDASNNELQITTTSGLSSDYKVYSNMTLVNGYKVINYITYDNSNYYCANGLAVVGEDGNIGVLGSKSYLAFFIEDDGKLEIAKDFSYKLESTGVGAERCFKIIATSQINNLKLGMLVINNGKNIVGDMFCCTDVFVNEYELSYTTKTSSNDLTISISEGSVNYDELKISDFITDIKASYTSCVFVVPQNDDSLYDFYILEDVTYTHAKDEVYVVVGYVENGKFVNRIRAKYNEYNEDYKKDSRVTKLYLLQLKNGYGQSTEDFVTNLISSKPEGTTSLDIGAYKNKLDKTTGFYVEFDLIVDSSAITLDASGEMYTQGSYNLTMTISCNVGDITNLCDTLYTLYSLKDNYSDYISSIDTNAFTIDSVTYNEDTKKIEINIHTGTQATQNGKLKIDFGSEFKSKDFTVSSCLPETIVYKPYTTGKKDIELFKNATDADNSNDKYIKVMFSWDSVNKTYVPIINLNYSSDSYSVIFNAKTSEAGTGFQDATWKNVALDIEYSLTSSDDFVTFSKATGTAEDYSMKLLSAGNGVLKVSVGGVDAYIKIIVDDNQFSFAEEGQTISKDYDASFGSLLTDVIDYKFYKIDDVDKADATAQATQKNKGAIKLSDFKVVSFGKAVQLEFSGEGSNEIKVYYYEGGNQKTILTLTDGEYGWKFERGDDDKFINLGISFRVSGAIKTDNDVWLNCTFKSTIQASCNEGWWQDNRVVLYQGTTVKLLDNNPSVGSYPLFKVVSTETITANVFLNDDKVNSDGYEFENVGMYTLSVIVGPTENQVTVLTQDVYVLPNLVATTTPTELLANTELNVKDIFGLKSVKTSVTYGSDETNMYTNTDNYTECSDFSNLKVTYNTSGKEITADVDDSGNFVLPLEKMGVEYNGKFTLMETIKNLTISAYPDVKLTNAYCFDKEPSELKAFEDLTNSFKLKKLTVEAVSEGGSLEGYCNNLGVAYSDSEKAKANGVYYSLDDASDYVFGTLTATQDSERYSSNNSKMLEVYKVLDNAEIDVTYVCYVSRTVKIGESVKGYWKLNGEEITDTTAQEGETYYQKVSIKASFENVKILPHTLTIKSKSPLEITAGSEEDLIKLAFGSSSADTYIKGVSVVGIYEKAGNEYTALSTDCFSSYSFEGKGGQTESKPATIKFNDIVGASKTYYILYRYYYNNGTDTYDEYAELTVTNRLSITLNCPTSDLKIEAKNADATNIDFEDVEVGVDYKSKDRCYEPVAIKTSSYSLVIDLCSKDTYLGVKRVDTKEFESVELVGYSSRLKDLVSISGSQITLLPAKGMYGYLVFKVKNKALNYDYYTVYLTSNNDFCTKTIYIDYTYTRDDIDYTYTTDTIVGIVKAAKLEGEYLKNCSLYALDFETLDSKYTLWSDTLKQYKKCDSSTISRDCKSHLKLRLAVVYISGVEQYCKCVIELNLKPSVSETVADDYKDKYESKGNGHYTSTIAAGVNTISNPFTVSSSTLTSITLKELDGESISDEDMSVSGDAITIKKFRDYDYTFIATYTYECGLILQVEYTLTKVTIKANNEVGIEVGKFVEGSGFNNGVTISDVIGIDTTNLGLEIKDGNTKIVILADGKSFELNQTTENQNKTLTFTFTKLYDKYGNNIERNYKFIVLKSISVTGNGNDGSTNSTPLSAVLNASGEGYKSACGSIISVTAEIKLDSYVQYTIGDGDNYTQIVAEKGSKLKINFSEPNYVNVFGEVSLSEGAKAKGYYKCNDSGKYELITSNEAVDSKIKYYTATKEIDSKTDTQSIQFVHLAKGYELTMQITVVNDSLGIYDGTYTRHISLPQTYKGIDAKYSTKGADHENVKNKYKIDNIYNFLFTDGGEYDTIDEDWTRFQLKSLSGGIVNYGNVDFDSMGFNDINNPNYITFSAAANSQLSVQTGGKVEFGQVEKNTMVNLILKNSAGLDSSGVGTASYTFQIMKSKDTNEGITYSIESGEGYVEGNKISLSVKKGKIVCLGTVNDESCNLFKISGGATDSYLYITDKDTSKEIGGYADGKIIVAYDADTRKVYAMISDFEDAMEKTWAGLTIYGTSGKIFDNVTLSFYNYEIVANYKTISDHRYALEDVSISELMYVDNVSFEEGKYYALTTDTAGGAYDLNGDDGKYYYGDGTYKVFEVEYEDKGSLNKDFSKLYTKEGDNYIPTLTFTLQSIEYKFQSQSKGSYTSENPFVSIDETMHILKFNNIGEDWVYLTITINVLSKGQKITEFTYNVYLHRSMQFAVDGSTLTLGADDLNVEVKLKEDNIKEGTSWFELSTDDLKLHLVRFYGDYRSDAKTTAEMSWDNVKLEYGEGDGLVDVVGNKIIKINKDYTGNIPLSLIYETANGVYKGTLSLNVTGLVTVKYAKDVTTITNGGASFASDEKVNIVSASVTDITGLILTNNTAYNEGTETKYKVTPNITISHVVINSNSDNTNKTNKELFGEGPGISDVKNGDCNDYTIKLPYVPQRDSDCYRVVYKITIERSGFSEDYYVSYLVSNAIGISSKKEEINVSKDLRDNKYLNLFYLEKDVSGDVPFVNKTDTDTGTDTEYSIIFNVDSNKIKTLADFDDFIEGMSAKMTVNGTSVYFELKTDEVYEDGHKDDKKYLESVKVYIDLTARYSDAACNDSTDLPYLFVNELITDFCLVKGGVDVVTVPKYNGLSGFKLYAEGTIVPKSSKTVSEIFGSVSDALKNLTIVGITEGTEGTLTKGDVKDFVAVDGTGSGGETVEVTAVVGTSVGKVTVCGVSYTIYKVTYSAGSVTNISSNSIDYYVIQAGNGKVVSVDYKAGGFNDCIEVDKGGSITLPDVIKVYSMDKDENKIECNRGTLSYSIVEPLDGFDIDDSKLTLKLSEEDEAKKYTITITVKDNLEHVWRVELSIKVK